MLSKQFGSRLKLTLFFVLHAGFLTTNAAAQSPGTYCAGHDALVNQLNTQYRETRTAMALSQSGKELVELFTAKNGTWTLVISNKDGKTCVMGAGNSWVNLPVDTNS